MNDIIKKIPVPITGLLLGLAASGNLLKSYGEVYKNLFGLLAAFILLMIVSKLIIDRNGVKKQLENPVVASVYPTLSMAIMILATYTKAFAPIFSLYLWGFAILMHALLIIRFSTKFLTNFNIMKVFPSWFIVYVGIVVASVTSPAFNMQALGRIIFWFGFASYFILLPVVLKRVFIMKEIPQAARPTLVIMCAPASLLLAGYMSAFSSKNMIMVLLLLALSQATYAYVLVKLPNLLRLDFYPSYSAFTFPVVITALSLKLTSAYLTSQSVDVSMLKFLVMTEEFIAVALVIYVLARYLMDLAPSTSKEVKTSISK